MVAGWSAQETRVLVSIWGEADVQSQLDGVVRNKVLYEKIYREMEISGFTRTWQQRRSKMKNLTHKYRKVGVIGPLSAASRKQYITRLLGSDT